jgi:cytochrome c oxidase assembly protein subunit 15
MFDAWRHRFAVGTVAATLALIFIGGLVTSTGSGLAVPDWPLSYGMLMPPMVGGVFYEHGHRMAATAVGFLTLVLAVWTARAEARRGVRRLAWAALLAVIAQGVLGGITVLYLLPTPVSVTHACLAQLFFCTTIALAVVTSREWLEAAPADDVSGLRPAALLAAGAVFVQLVLGAVMRHTGAGLAIPTFPTSFGRWVPPLDTLPVAIHFAHRAFALVVFIAVAWMASAAFRARDPRFRGPAVLVMALVSVQIALGAAAVLTAKAVTPTTAHVATGAAILGSCWWIALRARRVLRRPAPAGAPAPALGEPLPS